MQSYNSYRKIKLFLRDTFLTLFQSFQKCTMVFNEFLPFKEFWAQFFKNFLSSFFQLSFTALSFSLILSIQGNVKLKWQIMKVLINQVN